MSENQPVTTSHAEPEQTTQPRQRVVTDSEQRVRLSDLAEKLGQAVQVKRSVVGKIETMQRARQAAQADADAARAKWREKLREGDGTLTREVQKLRVVERSALSLAEEYASFEEEIAKDVPRVELEAVDLASKCISLRSAVIQEAAQQLYDETLMQVTDSLALAFKLFCRAANSGIPYRQQSTVDELAGQFFGRINRHICQRLDDVPVGEQVDTYLALPELDLREVDMDIVLSPVRFGKLRDHVLGSEAA
ncbi:hypothetical protein [Stenotrophomonas maltophilia]|jgi:hypothetical protein|uniref:hypothetical protein n=1 Tax=Stenotrophomonas maltophilia TaxID=40324 RepID=UPI000DAA2E29|nr:hypothetical protein [Stenotrophomonas maltophilia]PZS57653.1 hypothetical protein A7X58_09790 [Stenotrophomonas maltophilia]